MDCGLDSHLLPDLIQIDLSRGKNIHGTSVESAELDCKTLSRAWLALFELPLKAVKTFRLWR